MNDKYKKFKKKKCFKNKNGILYLMKWKNNSKKVKK